MPGDCSPTDLPSVCISRPTLPRPAQQLYNAVPRRIKQQQQSLSNAAQQALRHSGRPGWGWQAVAAPAVHGALPARLPHSVCPPASSGPSAHTRPAAALAAPPPMMPSPPPSRAVAQAPTTQGSRGPPWLAVIMGNSTAAAEWVEQEGLHSYKREGVGSGRASLPAFSEATLR